MENRIVKSDIHFCFINRNFLTLRLTLGSAFNGKWEKYSVHLFIISNVGFVFLQSAADSRLVDPSDLQEVIRIEINVADIARFKRDLQLMSIRAIHVLCS